MASRKCLSHASLHGMLPNPVDAVTLALEEGMINVWHVTFVWDVSDRVGVWKA
jgi:hypothetical protein